VNQDPDGKWKAAPKDCGRKEGSPPGDRQSAPEVHREFLKETGISSRRSKNLLPAKTSKHTSFRSESSVHTCLGKRHGEVNALRWWGRAACEREGLTHKLGQRGGVGRKKPVGIKEKALLPCKYRGTQKSLRPLERRPGSRQNQARTGSRIRTTELEANDANFKTK